MAAYEQHFDLEKWLKVQELAGEAMSKAQQAYEMAEQQILHSEGVYGLQMRMRNPAVCDALQRMTRQRKKPAQQPCIADVKALPAVVIASR
jgi:hypothetical protein